MLVRMLVQTTYILNGRRVTLRPGEEVDVPDELGVRWSRRRHPLAEPVENDSQRSNQGETGSDTDPQEKPKRRSQRKPEEG